jgi:hypothetical protein
MTYRFKLHEPIARGTSRIGLAQIDIAHARLASPDDLRTAVHDARRCLKRLRALLRIVRPALRENVYRREARRIVAIGRLLADERDRHVMHETLRNLQRRFGPLPGGIGPRLGKLLARNAGRESGLSTRPRRQALEGLARTRAFFARADRADIALEHVAEGLERTYRKARRAFREAYAQPSDEAFHGWRKAVQQHWRHMQLLSRGWPDLLGGRAGEAKELSRVLGEDHDLAVLLAFASEQREAELPARDRTALAELCRTCQTELRNLAEPRGRRLFAEPAADLSQRIVLYWSAAQRLHALAPAADRAPRPRNAQGPRAATGRRRPNPRPTGAQAASREAAGVARRSGR